VSNANFLLHVKAEVEAEIDAFKAEKFSIPQFCEVENPPVGVQAPSLSVELRTRPEQGAQALPRGFRTELVGDSPNKNSKSEPSLMRWLPNDYFAKSAK